MRPDDRLEVNGPAVVADVIDGEVVAISFHQGRYYNLQGWAAVVWGQLAAGRTLVETVTHLRGMCEGEVEILESETRRLAGELLAESLLRPRTDGMVLPGPDESVPADLGEFERLVLESFTDVEDLLLLDPVHDVDGRGWPHIQPGIDQ